MAITVTVLKGFNDSEFDAVKAALKAELPFRVTVRRHRQRRCWQAIDIRPTKQPDGWHRWTTEQAAQVCEFVKRHGFTIMMEEHLDIPSLHHGGLHYIYQVAR